MLLIFEIGFTGAVMADQKLLPSGWLLAACYYFTYLGLIVVALKPRRFVGA